MGLKVGSKGNPNARVMIVGEAPGAEEELAGKPFVGLSGKELEKQLREAGISLDDCYFTNVCKYRPPANEMSKWITSKKTDVKKQGFIEHAGRYAHPFVMAGRAELLEELARVQPELVIGLGNTPLWALTGNWGITSWRGSEMVLDDGTHFVPTLHPAAILRNFAQRPAVMHDLKQRCAKRLKEGFYVPKFNFILSPTFDETLAFIDGLHGDVLGDIETAKGRTICLGLAKSATEAICIPFWNYDGVSWSQEEQRAILDAIYAKRAQITWGGQNWNYDAQYIEEDFGKLILNDFDSYIAQTVLYPGVERSLGYLSSMYCEWHQYWKEDAKDWGKIADFNALFTYNCRDCCANWEVIQVQRKLLEQNKLMPQFEERMKYSKHVYHMMRNGINRDPERIKAMMTQIDEAVHGQELFVAEKMGHPVNFDSPKQVAKMFYEELKCAPQKNRKTGGLTTDDEALKKVAEKHPQHAELTEAILNSRSMSKLKSTYLEAEDDPDGKFRSGWMATGTETFRCSSGGNAFHRGGPVQNLTTGTTLSGRKLPNLRTTIVPSPGHTIFNCDLERADLQVVIWEADDAEMKAMMREHADIHTENAKAIFKLSGEPTYAQRQFGKKFVHLCVDEEHEALTKTGWKRVNEIQDGEAILVARSDGKGAYFAECDWYRGQCFSSMIHFEGEAVDQFVTFDHRMSYRTDEKSGHRTSTAKDLPKSARLPKSVWAAGTVRVLRPRLLCAFHADGSVDKHGNITFHFTKARKVARLRSLLVAGEYSERQNRDGTTTFYIPRRYGQDLAQYGKVLKSDCLQWQHADAVAYLSEQVHWDGCQGPTGGQWMSSVKKEHAEWAHTLAHLHGFGSQFHVRNDYAFLWSLNHRTEWRLASCKRTEHQGLGRQVYCPITPTGFWLTRRKGKISLTGNTNYGGSARTCAIGVHCTIHEAEMAQRRWFEAHPGIKKWHERTQAQLLAFRTITNRFGYRCIFFDRVDGLLPQALAWLPQSTVSILISLQQMAVDEACGVHGLRHIMQVHDSIVGEYPTSEEGIILPKLHAASKIAIPYPDPLYIPLELATSTDSWGEVEKRAWPV